MPVVRDSACYLPSAKVWQDLKLLWFCSATEVTAKAASSVLANAIQLLLRPSAVLSDDWQ